MSMSYSEEVFEKFQKLAIQSPDEFVVGQTYYTNHYPEKFTFLCLMTNEESYKHEGLVWGNDETAKNIEWINVEYTLSSEYPNHKTSMSLHDMNIGAHYNPWLIFSKKEDAEACKAELLIRYLSQPSDFEWRDL